MAQAADLLPAGRLVRRARDDAHAQVADVDAAGLAEALRTARLAGDVRFDAASRALYAHDASNYRRVPLGVVFPATKEDVIQTVEICRRFGAPIVARGGGTGLAGQTVNEAVVLDFSRRMNHIVMIDPERKRATVEPGVICDALIDAVARFGLTWGPKPATHAQCCFGGMLANNSGGMHAQMNGTASDNVESVDVLLYDGTRMHLGWMNDAMLAARISHGGPESRVLRALADLRTRYSERIREGYPKLRRRVSGYNLDELLPDADGRFNLARVIVGSEGTLVTMLDATVVLLDAPPFRATVVLGYDDVFAAGDAVPSLLDLAPLALEGMDDVLRSHIAKKGGDNASDLALLPRGHAFLFLEMGGASADEAERRAAAVAARARTAVDTRVFSDRERQRTLWELREAGLGATAFVPGEPDAWPGFEDSAVPPERLGAYLRKLRELCDRYHYHPALYGHFGMGVVHCRIPFDLVTEEGRATFRRFMSEAADLVVSFGGSLSGEHGDGQARGELLERMFGPELVTAMGELKAIFDPDGKMNPGKVVSPYPILDRLKVDASAPELATETHFGFVRDGGSMARAALRCVGVGRCRRERGEGAHDVMCPSYMVTREEKHTTRGRANLLWEMLSRQEPVTRGFRDEGVREALDLCLSCKGCKGDCPVSVDIATLKAEFFAHYYEGRLRPRHAYAFGLIDRWARLAELAPGLVNLFTQLPGLSSIAKLAAGVAADARVPPFAPVTFRRELARRRERSGRSAPTPKGRVLLFPDTFNDHFHPDTLMAAVRVLEATGREVVLPRRRVCCGRPLYEVGMLDRAKAYLQDLLAGLEDEIAAGLPIVFLEPSCASVLRDELADLLPGRKDAEHVHDHTLMLSELLARDEELPFAGLAKRRAIVQGHCHQKSVLGWASEAEVLRRTGLDVEVLDSGCCGMAGAFGFVAGTRPVGRAAGERVLLPRVRSERRDTLVIANGFSCREQIAQHTDRRGLHLAEVLDLALHETRSPSPFETPEHEIVERRRVAVRRSMIRAGALLLLACGLVVALVPSLRRRWLA